MRVRGDNAPGGLFTLEAQPKHPGFALARFYENVTPFEETLDGMTIRGYAYDEYHLELELYDGLEDDIRGNYAGYLAQAKMREAEGKTIPTLQQQLSALTARQAEAQTANELALAELAELIGG